MGWAKEGEGEGPSESNQELKKSLEGIARQEGRSVAQVCEASLRPVRSGMSRKAPNTSSASGKVSGSLVAGMDTAGGQYSYRLNKLLEPVAKQVKQLEKSGQTDEIAKLYLATVDKALAETMDWVTQHPDKRWQVAKIDAYTQGHWSAEGLTPGTYAVVARGVIAGREADWEGMVDFSESQTISVPLTRPRFFRIAR